jgi:2'-5' RNA ligase
MDGIVLPLAEQHEVKVQTIWAELAQAFDLHIQPTLAHVSLHVAEGYDAAALYPLLAEYSRMTAPITIQTTGLGLFTVPEPVLYVTVTCGRGLLNLHDALWSLVEPLSRGSVSYYQPGGWVPHITLAHGPRLRECLPDVLRLLGQRDYTWDIPISQLAAINSPLTIHETWGFQGQ